MANEVKLPGPIHTSEVEEVWRLYRAWDNGGGVERAGEPTDPGGCHARPAPTQDARGARRPT
jgi:hypothetical protein